MPFSLIKYHYTCQNTAADKEQCDPHHKIVVVAGFRAFCAGARVGLRRIGRFCCGAGSRNLNCRLIVAANLAFFMLGTLFGCGRFPVNNPLEIVSRLVFLFVAARAFFPMIVCFLAPNTCPCVPELCTCYRKCFCCANLSTGAALEKYTSSLVQSAADLRVSGF